MASITAREAKFSLAISSKPSRWRASSRSTNRAMAGSAALRAAAWSSIRSGLLDLGDPARAPSAGKGGVEPFLQNCDTLPLVEKACREHQDVGVAMLASQVRDFRRPGHRGADPMVPIGRVAHAEARAAQQNPARILTPGHPLRHLMGKLGVINGLRRIRAQTEGLKAQAFQLLHQALFELKTSMIGADRDDFGHWLQSSAPNEKGEPVDCWPASRFSFAHAPSGRLARPDRFASR